MGMVPDRDELAERHQTATSLDAGLLRDFDAAMECAAARAEEAANAAGDELGARFDAGLDAILAAAAADPDRTHLCLVEVPGLGKGGLEHREVGLQRFVGWLERELQASNASGNGTPPPLAAEMIVGGIYEVLQRKARSGSSPTDLTLLGEDLRRLWLPALSGR